MKKMTFYLVVALALLVSCKKEKPKVAHNAIPKKEISEVVALDSTILNRNKASAEVVGTENNYPSPILTALESEIKDKNSKLWKYLLKNFSEEPDSSIQYGTIDAIDVNKDGVLDAVYEHYTGGSMFSFWSHNVINGKTLEKFELKTMFEIVCQNSYEIEIPKKLLLPQNKLFYEFLKKRLEQAFTYKQGDTIKQVKKSDTFMAEEWMNKADNKKYYLNLDTDSCFRRVFHPKLSWRSLKKIDTLHSFYKQISKNKLKYHRGVFSFANKDKIIPVNNSGKYEVFTINIPTRWGDRFIGIFAKKGNLYKYLFATECSSGFIELAKSATLKTKNVRIFKDKYCVFLIYNSIPEMFICDIETGVVAEFRWGLGADSISAFFDLYLKEFNITQGELFEHFDSLVHKYTKK